MEAIKAVHTRRVDSTSKTGTPTLKNKAKQKGEAPPERKRREKKQRESVNQREKVLTNTRS
jgi:hypothetical protein